MFIKSGQCNCAETLDELLRSLSDDESQSNSVLTPTENDILLALTGEEVKAALKVAAKLSIICEELLSWPRTQQLSDKSETALAVTFILEATEDITWLYTIPARRLARTLSLPAT